MELWNNDYDADPRSPTPSELSDTELEFVSGGINPQPLPPRAERETSF